MKPSQLQQFMRDRNWSQMKMASKIGVGRDTLRRYLNLSESKDVPLAVALACSCIAWGLPPFGSKK